MTTPATSPPCDLCGVEPAFVSQMQLGTYDQLKVGLGCLPKFYIDMAMTMTDQDLEHTRLTDPGLCKACAAIHDLMRAPAPRPGEDQPGGAAAAAPLEAAAAAPEHGSAAATKEAVAATSREPLPPDAHPTPARAADVAPGAGAARAHLPLLLQVNAIGAPQITCGLCAAVLLDNDATGGVGPATMADAFIESLTEHAATCPGTAAAAAQPAAADVGDVADTPGPGPGPSPGQVPF